MENYYCLSEKLIQQGEVIMEFSKGSSLLRNSFKIGILLKGIDGVLEVYGRVFINTAQSD